MARFAVGDVQGCFAPLQCLLEEVSFNPVKDELWLAGDLVNRGPDSLGTLRFVFSLGTAAKVVLGNHDLHLLAVAWNADKLRNSDTFSDILNAGDRDELLDWLRHQPLIYTDPSGDYTLCHAGIAPTWTIDDAHARAREVEQVLRGDKAAEFFRHMYGNLPDCWDNHLQDWDRLRLITNYFTRMRFCTAEGKLDLQNKTDQPDKPGYLPWFAHPQRVNADDAIIFGHWASLEGKVETKHTYALDTGCVWGRVMTMMNLETQALHQCDCSSL